MGGAFNNDNAKLELDTIASFPPENHVFRVEKFDAIVNCAELVTYDMIKELILKYDLMTGEVVQ